MVNKIFKLFGLAGLIFLLNACSGVKVTSDYDKTVDFTKYKTYEYYGWSQDSDKLLNRFDKERIEKAFGDEFTKRGMKYVKSGGDLIVTLYIVTEQKQQTTATTTGVGGTYGGYGYGGYAGYGPGWGWGGGMATTSYNTYNYTDGTLVIDVYDAAEKKLVWESAGVKTINESTNGREERIANSVKQIMKPYPVAPEKK